jgi:hydroxymethylbilane synthase
MSSRNEPHSPVKLKLGTRGSALALWQANWVKAELERHWSEVEVELVAIKTSGDRITNVPLAEVGGKGLFTKEIDEALLSGRIDLAVHSMKDIPFLLPTGIEFCAIPEREDSRDAFLSDGRTLEQLTRGARVGTSSLRRQVQLLHRFPSIHPVMLRGNVDTRLKKLAAGEFDGIVLALAGLRRLGYANRATQILDEDVMLPAVGQGALGIVCRSGDSQTRSRLTPLDHAPSRLAVTAERGLLAVLEGSCKVPIAGKATLDGNRITLRGLVANLTGTQIIAERVTGDAARAEELGVTLGQELIRRGAATILAEINQHGASR